MRKIIPEEGRILLKKVEVDTRHVKMGNVLVPVTSSDSDIYEVVDDAGSFVAGEVVVMGGPWPQGFKLDGMEYFIVKIDDIIATVKEILDEVVYN